MNAQSIASNVANKNHIYFCIIICPLLAQSSPWVILSFAEFYFDQIKFRIGIPKFDVYSLSQTTVILYETMDNMVPGDEPID